MPTAPTEASVSIRVVVPERKVLTGAPPVPYDHIFEFVQKYSAGLGAEKIGAVFGRRQLLTGHLDIDLNTELVSVIDGSPVPMPIIMGMMIRNYSKTPGQALLLGSGATPFADWFELAEDAKRIGPGGVEVVWDPIDGFPRVPADTDDILRIAAADGPVDFSVLLLGRLA